MRLRGSYAVLAAVFLVAVLLHVAGCTSSPAPPVSLPAARAGQITFYVSLPSKTTVLSTSAASVATPGSSQYRHFDSLGAAGRQFGATDAQINTVAASVKTLGLAFTADPSRLFGRVSGSTSQWTAALGAPLATQPATAANPFTTYTLPAHPPAALHPSGTSVLLRQTQIYDPTAQGGPPPSGGAPPAPGAKPFPLNTGTPLSAGCTAAPLQQRRVYTPQQVQAAYGVDTLRNRATGTPVITVMDLGDGWLPSDLALAGQCFGFAPPSVTQAQGDGVPTPIRGPGSETPLDLQTVAAVAPKAQLRVVQSTLGGLLDGFSRALGDPRGPPDVISLSFGGCGLAENSADPRYVVVINAVLAMTAITGVSTFVAAGDSGSTTCGSSVKGTSLSYPAVSPFVTAVGGTRLALGAGNHRTSETVWNDSVFGVEAAGGGALSRLEPRPAYQNGMNPFNHRGVPDVSALADIMPGWPVVIGGALQSVGGTSGSAPFTAAATALVDASQRQAGHPRIGLANGWFYKAAAQPSTFFDVTKGSNDLAGVDCCPATPRYDFASGLGVPNWATLPAALPNPG
jgi:kumamolisin